MDFVKIDVFDSNFKLLLFVKSKPNVTITFVGNFNEF